MKKELTLQEIEERFAAINAGGAVEPTAEELAAMAAADAEDPADTITLDEYKLHKEYSGNLMLRIPKELHRDLAQAARRNGVSLNQYAAYKLAR